MILDPARAPRWWVVADQVARNALMAVPGVAGWRSRRGRTSAAEPRAPSREALEIHGYSQLDMVLRAVDGALAGKDVAEIGPGDHLPAALLFLAAGARRYVAFDRFAGDVAGPAAKALYRALADDLAGRSPELRTGLERAGIEVERFPEAYPDRVRLEAVSIEEAGAAEARFDVLVSTNVVEHLYDLDAFAANSRRLLAPGGVGVHRVDFGAHDVWAFRSDPLEWLTFSDRLWRMMGSRRGAPNRRRFDEVCEALRGAGFEVEAHVEERFPEHELRARRASLARRFRSMSVESLSVKTAVLVTRP